jgi:hypothetical protein
MTANGHTIRPELEAELQILLAQGQRIAAIKKYRDATGCSLTDVKRWLDEYLAKFEPPIGNRSPPCPYCEQPLRSPKAKQCLECGMDWHDPSRVVRRGNGNRGALPIERQ